MRRRLRIIANGKAASDPALREAVHSLRHSGVELEMRVTWEGGDAVRFAGEAVREGVDTVIAAGGDGTINEVVTGMLVAPVERLPSLGILPMGTANDFATACGLPLDILPALQLVCTLPPTWIDVGQVGGRFFINMATGGFGTQITVDTPAESKRALGGLAYLLTGLSRFSGIAAETGHFNGPGFHWDGDFLVLAVGNGRMAGGGHPLCPDACLNDGLLDVHILPNADAGSALWTSLVDGVEAVAREVFVSVRTPTLEVSVPAGLAINLDGEPLQGSHFRFEVRRSALAVHLPLDCPMLLR
ncbi:lipid kinase YegS [Aquaspirillum serpens]|uniref:lipid kinase YegS n=1 Tax=Aquaspirillum serpens TaxID=190 RepID=UPI0003B3A01C|nr:lipid kinase YegS [Aquaspirillum serpens]